MKVKTRRIDLKRLDKLESLYFYLLNGREGAYYWHFSQDYAELKKKVLQCI